ncbi:hypothetical protein CHS0354_033110 [Potamilus streckersoni]|uniref:Hemoglobinase n=1 Tax=Potamilus streckersoni TaxID=2493646 RepID=A0AAE0S675_9BIVA|nr:hypothetical protein CHS0354_033110 [Potamilus streckersoni]
MIVPTLVLSLLSAALSFSDDILNVEQPNKDGNHWAVLVAGSYGWSNYRHQADVCHAYQILKNHGIPDERIIVFMYDDIANNTENPTPGVIINQPNGPNVYVGVPKDYTGRNVKPDLFLNVLQGNADKVVGIGSGKVVKSGPNDHIFVNFVDHGAPGILAFGDDMLKSYQLMQAINTMHKQNKYGKMVFYVEACESGSMFSELLPKDISVYATTASNPDESSYACYYDKKLDTYLGDVYSIKWMQDSDKEDLNTETLEKQFKITKAETNTSHVMEYGDLTIGDMTVAEFQGNQLSPVFLSNNIGTKEKDPCDDGVPSEDVPLAILERKLEAATSQTQREQLEEQLRDLIKSRESVKTIIKKISFFATNNHIQTSRVMDSGVRQALRSWDCYEYVLDHLVATCPQLNLPKNDYALRHLYVFVNMCEERVPAETINEAITKVCGY